MALPDLTGQNIENTYQRVIQTDGTNFYDGTGSLVNFGGAVFPYTGSAIISGSLIVTGSTEIQYLTASGIPYPSTLGNEGEAIVIDQDGNLVFAYPKAVTERVKNVSGGPLQKGTPVHATGSGASGNITGVVAADAGDPLLMPATFVLNEALEDEAEGEALIIGYIQGVNTTGFQSGEVVYVGVGGGFTNVKPTGSALIQNLGLVLKGDSTNGSGVVYGSGRSNDVPNLPPGYAWIGNDNWVATAVPTSSFNEDPFPYTGSAAISGTLEVTGDVTIYGTASVDVLITNYESSSIIYSSGSTKFGDSLDDTHQFTGSVSIEGDITGSGKLNLDNGNGTIIIGNGAGTNITSAAGNVIIGTNAADVMTVSPHNVIIGTEAGPRYTTGYGSHVIIGYQAGRGANQNNDDRCVIIGKQAGYENVGFRSVAIGHGATFSSNASSTVSIGFQAHRNVNANATNQIAIGYEAGYQAQGVNSIFIGKDSGRTAAGANIQALGANAARDADGDYNIAIGTDAARNLDGEYNIAIGDNTLRNPLGIIYNNTIAIGHQAGYEVTGSNNILIGYQAGYHLTGSNKLIITDNSSSALVTGDFANNTFDVSGSISSTDTVTAVTGSFSHLKGNSPITVQDPVTFQHEQGLDVLGNATIHSINEVELQTISKNFNYTSSLNITEITASVNGAIIDYRLTNLNSGSRVGTFMYAHDGTELSYNDLTIPGGGIGDQPILSASLVNDLVKIDIENAAGFNFTGYAKKFNKLANAILVADPNINYLLNEFPGENALAAYSIRQLDQLYTGSAMRVRRTSDNAEINIEFTINGNLDTLAIEAHCGSSQGRITMWYDQSGNNNHISESNASLQPIIWTGAAFYTVGRNNRPALRPAGAFTLSTPNITPNGLSIVAESGNSYDVLLAGSSYSDKIRTNAGQTNFLFEGAGATLNIPIGGYLFDSILSINRNTQWEGSVNNNPIVTGSATGDFTVQCLFARNPGGASSLNDGYGQEFIFWENEQSNNTPQIKSNQNNYYDIYDTGLLAEYSGAAAAYSVRLLDSAYTGSALRIREDGTNTETDIGFDSNGDLDTASIASHCGANNGLVVTWYDQSGNGNDATQSTTTNQPKIYDSSTGIELENGKPIINLITGNSSTLLLNTQLTSPTQHIFGVAELDSGGNRVMIGVTNGGGIYIALNGNTGGASVGSELYVNGLSSTISTRDQVSDQFQTQTLFSSIQNLSSAGYDQTRIGMLNGGGDSYKMFNMQEIIFYNTSQSVDRDGIHNNINSYFNIYS